MNSKKQSLAFLEALIGLCLFSLLLFTCNPAHAAIKDKFGITGFPYDNHPSYVSGFKLNSIFFSNSQCSNTPDVYGFEPTFQGFHYDKELYRADSLGMEVIFSTQGGYGYENTAGSIYKRMPIADGKDALNPQSYKAVTEMGYQISARYGRNKNVDTARIQRYLMNATTAPFPFRANEVKAGLNLVNIIRFQNEFNFKVGWSGITKTFDENSYAVAFAEFYKAVKLADPTMGVMLGGQISPDINFTHAVIIKILSILPDAKFYLDFHYYMRAKDANYMEHGITPETAGFWAIAKQYNDMTIEFGLPGFYCTESGWATDNGKQSAPVLVGYTQAESQGILMIRAFLNAASLSMFKGICFWHSFDGYDCAPGSPYCYGGVNDVNKNPKPSRQICYDFISQYGNLDVTDFYQSDNYFTASLSNGTNLYWTNNEVFGEVTPMPKEAAVSIPVRYLVVNNSRLFWNDGTPCKIVEANSPENAIRWNDYAWLDWLNSKGVNTIYCSLLGGDDASVHPYINRSIPSQGFNQSTINQWKAFLEHWVAIGGGKNICHLLLSEKETHDALSIQDMKLLIDKMVLEFGHLPVIWDREEVPNNWSKATEIYSYLKSKDSYGLRGMHNNTSQNPWDFSYNSDLVQFCSFQESVNSFATRIPSELNKFTLKKTAGYSSEMTGGFVAGDVTKAQTIFEAGGTINSGAGVFVSSSDQRNTADGWYKSFESVYVRMAQLAANTPTCTLTLDCNGVCGGSAFKDNCNICVGGNTGKVPCVSVDTSSVIKFFLYDANTDLKLFEIVNGMSFSRKDSVAIAAEGVLPPVRLYFNGTQTRYEQKAPYSVFEETNGNFAPKGLSVGTHSVRALSEGHNPDKSRTITFTITSNQQVPGCTDPLASNYNSNATVNDGSCIYPVRGCMDRTASNYNPSATVDDGSCVYFIRGCTDSTAFNYNPLATLNDGSCLWNKPCPR